MKLRYLCPLCKCWNDTTTYAMAKCPCGRLKVRFGQQLVAEVSTATWDAAEKASEAV